MKKAISNAELQRCIDLLASARERCGEISTWRSYACDYPTHPSERFAGQSFAPTHSFRLDPSSIELRLVDCQFPEGLPVIPPQIKHIRMTRCSFPHLRALSSWKGVSLATNNCKFESLEGVDDVEFVSLTGQELWPGLGKNVRALQLNWWLGDLRHLPTGVESLFLGWHQSASSWEELHMPQRELELLSIVDWRREFSLAGLNPPLGLKVLLIELCSLINAPPDWSLFSGLIALSLFASHSNRMKQGAPGCEPLGTLPALIAALPNLQACELRSSGVEKEGPPKNRKQFNWAPKYDLRLALLKRMAPPSDKNTSITQLRKLLTSDDEQSQQK